VTPPSPQGSTALPPRGEPLHFVLYIDFSQLRIEGRRRAVQGAERWVRDTMKAEEKAMVTAFSSGTGLRQLTPPTTSKRALIDALESAYEDSAFVDSFPQEFEYRIEECREKPTMCPTLALQEYFHGRRSLRALKRLMSSLEELPGRKAVVYFHESGMMYPGEPYFASTMNHVDLSEQVGAAANQSLAAIYSVNAGQLPIYDPRDPVWQLREEQVLAMGSSLAEFTGGKYNHGMVDMSAFLDATERSCRCIYRLGLVPEEASEGRIYPARVVAAGHALPHRYRVQFLSDSERWIRKARLVLKSPGRARDIAVTAGIIPLTANRRKWTVAVNVVVTTNSMALLPGPEGLTGEWETGALLYRKDGSQVTEMLGVYSVRQNRILTAGGVVVHRRTIEGLPAGEYRLKAFVRDRTAGLFGGAEAILALPHPRKGGMIGPLWTHADRASIVSPLPILGDEPDQNPSASLSRNGSVPAGEFPTMDHGALEAHTWICPGKKGAKDISPLRFITRESEPLVRFPVAAPSPSGTCLKITDRIQSSQLEPGAYLYHLLWAGTEGAREAPVLEIPFQVP
jgi:VWFA-related protein